VVADIESSLASLIDGRPELDFGPVDMEVRGQTCADGPVCSLVVAVYESVPWQRDVIVLS